MSSGKDRPQVLLLSRSLQANKETGLPPGAVIHPVVVVLWMVEKVTQVCQAWGRQGRLPGGQDRIISSRWDQWAAAQHFHPKTAV